jgi:hypothetical protein
MSETIYDGPPSPADNERALVDVAAERDQLRQQIEKLLGAVDKVKAAPGRESGGEFTVESRRPFLALFDSADQVRKELEE